MITLPTTRHLVTYAFRWLLATMLDLPIATTMLGVRLCTRLHMRLTLLRALIRDCRCDSCALQIVHLRHLIRFSKSTRMEIHFK